MSNLSHLTEKLGYTFQNPAYLRSALTHRSAAAAHNERLEFLGDSILNTIITIDLYRRFPEESEGQLSRLRSHLVKGDMLAQVAKEINLGEYLTLGPGELKTGGFRRTSILADALEAIFAAVFLDSDFHTCQVVILSLFKTRLDDSLYFLNIKDPKTQLQEYLQAHKQPLPEYVLLSSHENEDETIFHVACQIQTLQLKTVGEGSTRRKAEQEAANELLILFKAKE